MGEVCANGRVEIRVGDCRELLREMDEASVDSIVTDPPYGLGFMGKAWDSLPPGDEVFRECLRVLKPGGWLLAFGGTRTYHRLACAIEDAGFEVRDQIGWAYGSGFPKSLDVSKGIDKAAGVEGDVVPTGAPVKRMIPGADQNATESWIKDNGRTYQPGAYVPGTPEAAQWQGWGTALKPAWEPICVARKPLIGTVAENVLAHGTGALNIDGCRIDGGARPAVERRADAALDAKRNAYGAGVCGSRADGETTLGRWPANLCHDGSDEVLACFPDSAGQNGATGPQYGSKLTKHAYGDYGPRQDFPPRGDNGSAARFFYCAKASRSERGEFNTHPTVKPVALMQWLVRLVTPPGGTVLDPFGGSGSTGLAAAREGFRAVLCELNPEYAAIAERRIRKEWREPVKSQEIDLGPLFGGANG